MAKERYRLTRLRDCPDGARFYFVDVKPGRTYLPYTLVTQTKSGEAVYHLGHQFKLRGTRYRCRVWCRVWMKVE